MKQATYTALPRLSAYAAPASLVGKRFAYFSGVIEVTSARRIPGGTVADVRFVGDLPASWCECWAIPPSTATVCANELRTLP
jgi:hypothetical protein